MDEAIGGVGMSVDDRHGVATVQVAKEGKLECTGGVLVHASVESVSQVWQAGPFEVRLAERGRYGGTWLVVEAQRLGVLGLLTACGAGYREAAELVDGLPQFGVHVELALTETLDRLLVELVDVIADVRRAAGTVQLAFEDVVEQGVEEGGQ